MSTELKNTNDTATVPAKAAKPPAKPGEVAARWYRVVRGVLLVAALLVMFGLFALGVAVRQLNLTDDFAMSNVSLVICVFFGTLTMVAWTSLFACRGWSRLIPPAAMFLLMAAPFSLLKIREVDGEMIPIFAWRFAPDPDERLDIPKTITGDEAAPLADMATVTPDDFPRFLGPGGTQHVEHTRLIRDWESNPPNLVWQQPIGAGWSAFAVRNGLAVTMEQRGPQELVTCYDVMTGGLVWSHGVEARYETKLGGIGPRATPTIDERGMVYANGATGVLRCIDGNTGQLVWRKDVREKLDIPPDYDAGAVLYGRSNSPLVHGDLVVVPGGAGPQSEGIAADGASLVAFHKDTGEVVWRGGHEQIGYATPVLATLDGVQQVLTVNESSVSGHDAADGRELWRFPWPGGSAGESNNSQPIAVGDTRVFVTKAYGVGAALMEVRQSDAGDWTVEEVWHDPSVLRTKFTNVVVHDGYVYGLSDGILECIELTTGQRMWKKGRFHQGQILGVGDVLLVINEKKGTVSMIDMTPEGYDELGKFTALQTDKVWNHLALYGKYLLVRDAQTATCWELAVE